MKTKLITEIRLTYTENQLKSMSCYMCAGPERDPFCHNPVPVTCRPGEICYEIHLSKKGLLCNTFLKIIRIRTLISNFDS